MACRMPHKYEKIENFMSVCKQFVNSIENFNGTDRLINWYEYLLWIEENFVIDFKRETIFDQILGACLCHFENDDKYKEDRRLIKLFITYVSK